MFRYRTICSTLCAAATLVSLGMSGTAAAQSTATTTPEHGTGDPSSLRAGTPGATASANVGSTASPASTSGKSGSGAKSGMKKPDTASHSGTSGAASQ